MDPFGEYVFTNQPMANNYDVVTLTRGGWYTLIIEGHVTATETASYSFNAIELPPSAIVQIPGIGTVTPGPDLQVRDLSVTPTAGSVLSAARSP